MIRTHTQRRRFRGGGSLLELVLLMPVLLGLSFGAGEYGYALYIKHTLQGAAREGVRAAVVAGATATDIQNAVDGAMSSAGFATSKYTRPPTIEYSSNGGTSWSTSWSSATVGQPIRVTVAAQWSNIGIDILPSWLGGIPSTKSLTGVAAMRKEG